MDDFEMIGLFCERSEQAISEMKGKYHSLLMSIAFNITGNQCDAEECAHDTYLKLWNTIPPQSPSSLKAYAARISRNLAIDRYRSAREERKHCELNDIWTELEQCMPNKNDEYGDAELKILINGFMASLVSNERILFVKRYWQAATIKALAKQFGLKESAVKMRLLRTRNKFQKYLAQEGIII
ncbi:MAG: polymerase sigma-70 factor, subfamily [Herbinix sp.]|jgi:RNA polymerase sigma-70 factor (ECF subfamily)|nr:polymerase sigma-70 factor, subfamily [Herbinix sp.]